MSSQLALKKNLIRICVLPVDVNGRNPKPKNTNPASPTALLPPTHTNKKIQNLLVLHLLPVEK
jgi:hypothetical protein